MRKKLIVTFFVFALAFLFSAKVFAYDDKTTHPALTQEIVDFYNASFPQNSLTPEQKEWVIKGSILEDTSPRWINHFYDPIYKVGWSGEHAGAIEKEKIQEFSRWFIFPTAPVSSLEWTHNNEIQAKYGFYKGSRTWERGMLEMVKGNEKEGYEILGHILHLLEDASVPEHSRNDTHAPEAEKATGDFGSPFEEYLTKYNREKIKELRIIDNLQKEGLRPIQQSTIDDYLISLAEYSNKYFFSKDTINDPKYQNPKIVKEDDNFGYGVDEGGKYFPLALIDKKWDSEKNDYIVSHLLSKNEPAYYPILDAYFSRLAPKTVLHGAGIIDLFKKEVQLKKEYPQHLVVYDPSSVNYFKIPSVSFTSEFSRAKNAAQSFVSKITSQITSAASAALSTANAAASSVQSFFTNIVNINPSEFKLSSQAIQNIVSPKEPITPSDLEKKQAGEVIQVIYLGPDESEESANKNQERLIISAAKKITKPKIEIKPISPLSQLGSISGILEQIIPKPTAQLTAQPTSAPTSTPTSTQKEAPNEENLPLEDSSATSYSQSSGGVNIPTPPQPTAPANAQNFTASYNWSDLKINLSWQAVSYPSSTYEIQEYSSPGQVIMRTSTSTSFSKSINEVARNYTFSIQTFDKDGAGSAITSTTIAVPSFLDSLYFYRPTATSSNYLIEGNYSKYPFAPDVFGKGTLWKVPVLYLNGEPAQNEIFYEGTNPVMEPSDLTKVLSVKFKRCSGGSLTTGNALILPDNASKCGTDGGAMNSALKWDELEDKHFAVFSGLAPSDKTFATSDYLTVAYYSPFDWAQSRGYGFKAAAVDKTKYYFRDSVPSHQAPSKPQNLNVQFFSENVLTPYFSATWSTSTDSDTLDHLIQYKLNYYLEGQNLDENAWQATTSPAKTYPTSTGKYFFFLKACDEFNECSGSATTDYTITTAFFDYSKLSTGPISNPGQTLGSGLSGTFDSLAMKHTTFNTSFQLIIQRFDDSNYSENRIDYESAAKSGSSEDTTFSSSDFSSAIVFDSAKYYRLMFYQCNCQIYGSDNPSAYANGAFYRNLPSSLGDSTVKDAYFSLKFQ